MIKMKQLKPGDSLNDSITMQKMGILSLSNFIVQMSAKIACPKVIGEADPLLCIKIILRKTRPRDWIERGGKPEKRLLVKNLKCIADE